MEPCDRQGEEAFQPALKQPEKRILNTSRKSKPRESRVPPISLQLPEQQQGSGVLGGTPAGMDLGTGPCRTMPPAPNHHTMPPCAPTSPWSPRDAGGTATHGAFTRRVLCPYPGRISGRSTQGCPASPSPVLPVLPVPAVPSSSSSMVPSRGSVRARQRTRSAQHHGINPAWTRGKSCTGRLVN